MGALPHTTTPALRRCPVGLPACHQLPLQAPMTDQELWAAHLLEMRRLSVITTILVAVAAAALEAQEAERRRSLAHAGPAFAAALVSFLVQLPAWVIFYMPLTTPLETWRNMAYMAEAGANGWVNLISWAWVAKWLWGGAVALMTAGARYYNARRGNI